MRDSLELPIVCPVCRRPPKESPIDSDTFECTDPDCRTAFPRLTRDIPIVFDGSDRVLEVHDVLGDLEPAVSLASRLRGLASNADGWERAFRVAMYVDSHWAGASNLLTRLCDELLPHVDFEVGHAVDLGCGPGRLTVEVAHRTGAVVIGLDADPLPLRWAELAARGASFEVPVRRTASTFEMRSLTPSVDPTPGRVRWLCGDVVQPPLPAESFDLVLAVNLLDTVPDPWVALGQASALLREGGYLLLAQPDAWSPDVTPRDRWLAEDSEGWDRALARFGLDTVQRRDGLQWELKRTDRLRFGYTLHARLARRGPWPGQGSR